MHAVRRQNGLAMPPDGKLMETQIASLVTWIKDGHAGRDYRLTDVHGHVICDILI
jgi:hypothetical protein